MTKDHPMTSPETAPKSAPESLPPGETFDPTKPLQLKNGTPITDLTWLGSPYNCWRGLTPDGRPVLWHRRDGVREDDSYTLVNTPPPVSVPASKCDGPGQADAAVAEADPYSPLGSVAWLQLELHDCAIVGVASHLHRIERALKGLPSLAYRAVASDEKMEAVLGERKACLAIVDARKGEDCWAACIYIAEAIRARAYLAPRDSSSLATRAPARVVSEAEVEAAALEFACCKTGWPKGSAESVVTSFRKQARAVLEAALRATAPGEQSDGWQSIETAPADIDVLLAWPVWPASSPDKWVYEAGWAAASSTVPKPYSNGHRHGSATHWRPLPTPPTAAPYPPVDHAGGQGENPNRSLPKNEWGSVEDYVADYTLEVEPSYTPTENERFLLVDAITGYVEGYGTSTPAANGETATESGHG